MDIKNHISAVSTTLITTLPQATIDNTSKRYTVLRIANKPHAIHANREKLVICTKENREKQQIIDFYNYKYSSNCVVKLDHNNDLTDNDLLNVITCNQLGKLQVGTGRLFANEPLLLIIDLTNMASGDIARLNDLLSVPATYNGKPISNTVNMVIIINAKMLVPGINKPSADLWRRLAKFKLYNSVDDLYTSRINSLQQANNALLNQELLAIQVKDVNESQQNKNTTTVNFSAGNSWQELLFGGLTLDIQGNIYFQLGCLANKVNTNLVLHNAPWDNLEFTDALATALRQGGFRANGSWVQLANSLSLNKSSTSEQQIASLTHKHVILAENITSLTNNQLAIINSANFANIFADTQLLDGIVIHTDTLTSLTLNCKYLLITEQLTKQQWLKLLTRVSCLVEPAPQIIDASNSSIATINRLMQSGLIGELKCVTYKHKQDAVNRFNSYDLTYQITADTNWIDMWRVINLTSQENFSFSTQDTKLLTAIKQNKSVVFYGLETNYEILKNFESLLIAPSYLFLNGNKITINSHNIILLFPENSNRTKLPKLLQNILQQHATAIVDSTVPIPNITQFINQISTTLVTNNILLTQDSHILEDMFIKQLAIEKQQDQIDYLLPIHYRKAAHTIFAKSQRDNLALYSYLKVQIATMMPDDNHKQEVDATALVAWLTQHPEANRKLLTTDFWLLARHCSAGCFFAIGKNLTEFKLAEITDQQLISRLANILLAIIPKEQQTRFAKQFEISDYNSRNEYIVCYDGAVISAITDAMLTAKNKLKITKPISKVTKEFAVKVYDITQNQRYKQAIEQVAQLLTDIFPAQLLHNEFKNLATSLVEQQINIQHKQVRKKQRLAARITNNPLVFLQGVAGAGKSHMARTVVNNLQQFGFANMPEPLVLSLGPETTAADLFGVQILQHTDNDAYTEFVAGKILNWATNDNPQLLILDEANLVANGVLAPLAGLNNSPPQITYAGNAYTLSSKHRIILTGNLSNYDGRHMDTAVSEVMLTLHYKSMTDDELAELIIKPALATNLIATIVACITNSILYLYNQYSKVIYSGLGPRDLQDILARINRIIAHHDNGITPDQIHSLVLASFSEILASSVNDKTQLEQIVINYQTKFAITSIDNSILNARNQKFTTFYQQLVYQHQELDLSSAAVKQLVKDYWLFLDSQASLQGRRGLWVEGPAGWGKDSILNAVLILWEQQEQQEHKFIHINANPNQWDKLVATVKLAMENGQKLVISELNLLPSRYLEGLFNDVLTGKTSLGFMLFATVNPSCYSNRESLSAAFMNRMTLVKLQPVVANELYQMLLRRYPNQRLMVEWLFSNYLDLTIALTQQRAPIQLSLANLLETATKLVATDASSWSDIFQQDYALALLMIKTADEFILQAPGTVSSQQSKEKIKGPHRTISFNNITKASVFYPIQYFAGNWFKVSDYRLKLYKPLVAPGEVGIRQLTIANEQIKTITPPELPSTRPIYLASKHLLGRAELELSYFRWVALPGISYCDECIAISHTDLIELGRCPITNMLVVKLKNPSQHKEKLTLDFIIKPDLTNIDNAKVAHNIQAPKQDSYLQELLNQKIFATDITANKSIRKLQQIKLITDKKQQVKELIIWASNFTDYIDIHSEGADALIDAIRYQTGVCRHRAIAFQILAEYFGIPTICISSHLHMFIEFSLDNEQTWIRVNLGGSSNSSTKIYLTEQKFLDYTGLQNINLYKIHHSDKDLVYKQQLQDLVTEPNQLIRFLNFVSKTNLIYDAIYDLFNVNFYKYVNNTTAVFSEVLPNIFKSILLNINNKNIIIELHFVYRFFATTYTFFQQGKISSEIAQSILCTCLPLVEDGLLYTAVLLNIIEYLAEDGNYKEQAQKIITKYYANFKKNILWQPDTNKRYYSWAFGSVYNTIATDKIIYDINSIYVKSQVLIKFLKQVAIKTKWSYTSTGKSPNINRLATRKAAFPINVNQQNEDRNICIYLGSAFNYYQSCQKIFYKAKEVQPEIYINIPNFRATYYAFINWLFAQMFNFKLNFLIDNNMKLSSHLQTLDSSAIGYIRYDATMFTQYLYADMFCNALQKHDIYTGTRHFIYDLTDRIKQVLCNSTTKHDIYIDEDFFIYDLNTDRIKQVFGDSAVLITKDIIVECFNEYLKLLEADINNPTRNMHLDVSL